MIKSTLLIIIFSLLFIFEMAGQITFQKTYGGIAALDEAHSVAQTTDGGYILAGTTLNFGAGGTDAYLIKTDAYGDTLWTKTYGGADSDNGYSVEQTSDGGYILAGRTRSFGSGGFDVYVVKTDANGTVQWSKAYGGTANDHSFSVSQTSGGDYIVAGYTGSFTGNSYSDFYLLKLNASGDTLWTRLYGKPFFESCYSAQPTADGGVILTGMSQESGLGSESICLIKTDSFGDTLWTKNYDGPGYEHSNCVQQTSDGGYIITGHGNSFGTNNADMYLIKTDSVANLLWSKTYGGLGRLEGWYVQQTNDGGYIVTGWCDSLSPNHYDVFLVKTNAAGDTLWTRTYGGPNVDEGFCVKQTSDGGYIVAGFENSFTGSPYQDCYLIKVDANGNGGCNQVSSGLLVSIPSIPVVNNGMVVSSGAIITIPSTLTGNGSSIITLCPTGINELATEDLFQIYPNPTGGEFEIEFPELLTLPLTLKGESTRKAEIEIFNVYGMRVYQEGIFSESKKKIRLDVASGVYFVKVRMREKGYCEKIVIEREFRP